MGSSAGVPLRCRLKYFSAAPGLMWKFVQKVIFPFGITYNNFIEPLTFRPAPSPSQNFNLFHAWFGFQTKFLKWKTFALFFFSLSFSVLFLFKYILVQVKLLKVLRSKSAPTEAPLSHGKHCSRNASSVVPPQILFSIFKSNLKLSVLRFYLERQTTLPTGKK